MSKKILIIAPQPFFENRGTPINVRAMTETLSQKNYDVDLLVYPLGQVLAISRVNILRPKISFGIKSVHAGASWKKVLLDIPLLFKAISLSIKNDYEIYHGIEEGAIIAGILSFIKKRPFIFDMDSYMSEQMSGSNRSSMKFLIPIVRILENYFLNKSSAVLTVCTSLTNKAKTLTNPKKVYQIEDCPLDQENSNPEASLVKEIELKNKKIILYTGNLEPYQGIDLLIDAYEKVITDKELKSSSALVIVGGGDVTSKAVTHYKDIVRQKGLLANIHLTGNRPGENMQPYMQEASILASPRNQGGNTPLKIYTYMQAQKPIVATNLETHTQVLNEENSFLADPTPESYAKALTDALTHPKQAAKKAKKAASDVTQKYSRTKFEEKLLTLYSHLLKN